MTEKTNEIFENCLKKGLKPMCIYCENSDPEEFMQIKCLKNPKYKNKIIEYNKNFFSKSCEHFLPSRDTLRDMIKEAIDEGTLKS